MFEEYQNLVFNLDPKAFMQGYIQSAMLAGAYSGYNPIYMNFAGMCGGFYSLWTEKS